MSKYIDRDKLAEFARHSTIGIDANDIMRFPTADDVEVKHGEWKTDREEIAVHYGDEYEVHIPYCSECGWKRSNVYEYLGPGKVKWNFCPECGADMREGKKQNDM